MLSNSATFRKAIVSYQLIGTQDSCVHRWRPNL